DEGSSPGLERASAEAHVGNRGFHSVGSYPVHTFDHIRGGATPRAVQNFNPGNGSPRRYAHNVNVIVPGRDGSSDVRAVPLAIGILATGKVNLLYNIEVRMRAIHPCVDDVDIHIAYRPGAITCQ